MDETMTEDHRRYCPSCSGWVGEDELQVPADGKPRHKLCGTVTAPGAPMPGPEKLVVDKCEWDGTSLFPDPPPLTAEKQAELEKNLAELRRLTAPGKAAEVEKLVPGLEYVGSNGLRYRGDPDAPTGPLTPGQVECRSCRLDDRTRAATDPGDLLCGVCRENASRRIPQTLTTPGEIREALFRDIAESLLTAGASADYGVRGAIREGLLKRGWVPGARRRAAELPKATATISDVPVPKIAHQITVAADRVGGGLPADADRYEEQPVEDTDGTVIGHVWEVLPMHRLEHPREWVAAVDENTQNRPRFGSRDSAEDWVRVNAPRDGRPLTVPYDAEKVIGAKSAVIGWVWLDPEHAGADGRWLAVHGSRPENQHPLWGSPAPGLDARNQAIGWVLEQDKEARNA